MTSPLRPMVTEAKQQAIGIDIGGTKIAAGVIASDGTIIQAAAVPTPQRQDALVQSILDTVSDLRRHHPGVIATGVGAAGIVDWPNGHIRWAPNNTYQDLPLQQLLTEGTGLPAIVENDANAAAWAEATVGAGAGLSNIIGMTIGTGIGAGLILNRELHRGDTGIAGEVGHMLVNPSGGEQCGCGTNGCLEALASGTALGRAGRKAAAENPAGQLARLAGGADKVTGETVHQAARAGDPAAREL